MRPIEFRGKDIKTGKWVYGPSVQINSHCYIVDEHALPVGIFYFDKPNGDRVNVISSLLGGLIPVIPETVGQFTGLKDKNGKKLYVHDIITLSYGVPPITATLVIEYAENEEVADGVFVSGWWMRNIRPGGISASLCQAYHDDIIKIGDIHTNPELLEQES